MPIKAVGAYIYAGGFTEGVLRSNRYATEGDDHSSEVEVICHLEDPKPYGLKTFQLNFPTIPVYPHGQWPIESLRERGVDLVYGNPPCKAFSQLGFVALQGRDAWKDPRLLGALGCTHNVVDLLRSLQPPLLVWESVTGALNNASELIHKIWTEAVKPYGYSFTIMPHNASWHGSVQNRPRVLFICHKGPLIWPEPNYAATRATVAERLASVADVGITSCYYDEEKELRTISRLLDVQTPGMSLRNAFDIVEKSDPSIGAERNKQGQVKGRPSLGWGIKLRLNELSNVVCKAPFIHPTERRYCSLQEMTVLADFRPGWEWGPKSGLAAVREMARGVSPYVGEFVAEMARLTLRTPTTPTSFLTGTTGGSLEPRLNFVDLRLPREKRTTLDAHFKKRKVVSPLTDSEPAPSDNALSQQLASLPEEAVYVVRDVSYSDQTVEAVVGPNEAIDITISIDREDTAPTPA